MAKPELKKKKKIRDELIYDTIMECVNGDVEKAVRPQTIATLIYPEEWQSVLKRIRIFACKLAKDGYVNIIRKGEIADPDDFRGVYRIRATADSSNYEARMPTA